MGFVVGNLSPEPPTFGDQDLVDSIQSEDKRNWLGSRLTFKTFGTFRKGSKQASEGSDFVSGGTVRKERTADDNEQKGWRENINAIEDGLPHRPMTMPTCPRRTLARGDEDRISIDSIGGIDPWMDRVKRSRHLSEATFDSIIPRSVTGSRAEGMATVPDEQDGRRPSELVESIQSTAEVREVPIFLDENSSRRAKAGTYEDSSDAAISEAGSDVRSWRGWSLHGGIDRPWEIDSVRVSRFRISAFERRSESSSLAETREEV